MKFIWIILCLLIPFGCVQSTSTPSSSLNASLATAVVQSPLLIGVYMQPASNFQKWKDRGCNTIVTDKSKPDSPAETPASRTAYFKAAADMGLRLIIGADPTGPAADLSRPGLLAWSLPDEPENWPHLVKRADGSFDWDATIANYTNKAIALHSLGAVPVFGNFNGGPLGSARETDTNPKNVTLAHYRRFAEKLDWIAADFYIRPQGRPPEQLANYGKVQDRLQAIAPGKPTYAVIECADQGLTNGAAPNASEVRAAVWISMIHGARGIIYFPLKVQGGFAWDNTSSDVAVAMPIIAAELQANVEFFTNGQRAKDAATESATWTLANGSTLKATAAFANGAWSVNVVRNIVVVDPEKEALKAENAALKTRLKNIDDWRTAYPQ